MCEKCPDAARLHDQRAEKTWQQGVDRLWSVPIVWFLLGPTTGARRDLQRSRRLGWKENSQTQALPPNPEGSEQRNPGRLIFTLPLLSQDAVPPWTCV